MEDLHSLSSPGGNGKGGAAGKIVDAVVKLYLPDHSHKYLDISPVSGGIELMGVGCVSPVPSSMAVVAVYCVYMYVHVCIMFVLNVFQHLTVCVMCPES